MRQRKAVQKKAYIKPIILGFTLLYVIIMVLSTYLMKIQFEKEFSWRFIDMVETLTTMIGDEETLAHEEYELYKEYELPVPGYEFDDELYFRNRLKMAVSRVDNLSKYQQFSAAVYDYSGERVAQSISYIYFYFGNMNDSFYKAEESTFYFELAEYFTEEETERFMQYYKEMVMGEKPYFTKAYFHRETGELARILVFGGFYEEDGGHAMTRTIEYDWRNPDIEMDESLVGSAENLIDINCPGFVDWGEKNYERWIQDEYLQNYPEKIDGFPKAVNDKYDFLTDYYRLTESVSADWTWMHSYTTMKGEEKPYIIKIRQSDHPWLAAMDYLKYVYLVGFLLAAGCIAGVIYSANKTYAQRIALEKSRRDFTNAIAHEQKTPLGIIRGFAENLKENTVEEKREYYIDQIIGQTEEMDRLVQEMISVSKLDSEDLTLKKENISIKELMEEQFACLEVLADKKNLEIRYCMEEEFRLEGDKDYLEKAIWNLLSNAIEYNRQDGFINVHISSNKCSIENSGRIIAEEDLPHVCEMFYTGNKSRNSKERHTGLGLYLAKRIFEMHHLKIVVENTSAGVKVTILK